MEQKTNQYYGRVSVLMDMKRYDTAEKELREHLKNFPEMIGGNSAKPGQ